MNIRFLNTQLGKQELRYRYILIIVMTLALFSMLMMSRTTAISGDESKYINQAEKVYEYFASGGKDKAAVTQVGIDPQHFNAQSFDVIIYTITKWCNIQGIFEFRHGMNALTGWLAMLFTALIALRLFGTKNAIIAFILIYISPRFLGNALNNHRDIPLAFSFAFTIYYLLSFIEDYPKKFIKNSLLIVFGVTSAYSLRLAGGILLSAFVLLFVFIQPFFTSSLKECVRRSNIKLFAKLLLIGGVIVSLAFGLGLLIWPFGLEAPIAHAKLVMHASSSLGVSLTQVFEGHKIWSNGVPWYYTPKWIIISVPLIVILGWCLYFVCHGVSKFKYFNKKELILICTGIFPIAYTMYATTNDYGAWRHFIFVYPSLIILAVGGLSLIFRFLKKPILRYIAFAMIGGLMISPTIFVMKNHPYHYVYFNEFVGGVGSAYKTYETDYSGLGVLGGAEWIKEQVIPHLKTGEKITITTNNLYAVQEYLKDYSEQVNISYTRYYEKYSKDWDYAILYCGYIDPYQLQHNLWPPKEAVHTIYVDGFPIAAVLKKNSNDAIKGFQELSSGQANSAIAYFSNYLKINPYAEEVYLGLAKSYLALNQLPQALTEINKALEYYPDYRMGNYFKGIILQKQTKYAESIISFDKYINAQQHAYQGYCMKAISLNAIGKPKEALAACNQAIQFNGKYGYNYMVAADILTQYKNVDKAIELYNRAESLGTSPLTVLEKKAYCYFMANKMDSAQACLNRMIQINPHYIGVYKMRVRLLINEKNYVPAGSMLNELLKQVPNEVELKVIAARYCMVNNQMEQARSILTEVCKDSAQWEAHELLKSIPEK